MSRVERLEKQNRWLKRAGLGVVATVGVDSAFERAREFVLLGRQLAHCNFYPHLCAARQHTYNVVPSAIDPIGKELG